MKKEMFDELLESVQEMDEIVQGKKKASRSFDYLILRLRRFMIA